MSCDCKCGCGTVSKYYVPDDLKMPLTITCEGFNQDTDPWTATIVSSNGGKYVCDKKTNTVVDEDGQWYLLFRTEELGSGMCSLVVEIDIPDADFGGFWHEVYVEESIIRLNQKPL